MEKKEAESRKNWIISGVIIVLLAALAVYLIISFGGKKTCGDLQCFQTSLRTCEKSSFVSEEASSSWLYSISGKSKDNSECVVSVVLLQIKQGTADTETLQGLAMDCSLPIGYVANPQDDLTMCHGILKEQIQDLIIKRMHSYILKNVGQISEELTNVLQENSSAA